MKTMLLKPLYRREISEDLAGHPARADGVFTEAGLAALPEPVRRYFRRCGYVGRPKMTHARVTWEDVYLKTAPDGDWMKIDCHQYNSVAAPTRIVYMHGRLLRVIPFEGRDKYQHGRGHMLIRMMKLFTVGDARGPEMDASALVTVLAETFLVPSYALQPYLHWTPVDANTAQATITYNATRVGGTFHFNDRGEMLRFDTNDRYLEEKGSYRRAPWSAFVDGYFEQDGLLLPEDFRAVWHLDSGDMEYFTGKISRVEFG
jgi:hypothetical protein